MAEECDDWRAKQARITLFFQTKIPPEFNFWGQLVGTAPDHESKDRAAVNQQGQHGDRWLVVTTAGHRIDVILVPPPTAGISNAFADIGDFRTAIADVIKLVRPWLSATKDIEFTRVAIGSQLIREVDSRIEGYRELGKWIPLKLDGNQQSDFSFQINFPIESSTIEGLKLNRLTQWSVTVTGTFDAASMVGMPMPTNPSEWNDPRAACEVNVDFNSIPNMSRRFNSSELLQLSEELAALISSFFKTALPL